MVADVETFPECLSRQWCVTCSHGFGLLGWLAVWIMCDGTQRSR